MQQNGIGETGIGEIFRAGPEPRAELTAAVGSLYRIIYRDCSCSCMCRQQFPPVRAAQRKPIVRPR